MAESAGITVELDESDVPGATLSEPLDAHNVAALRMWLTCRGMKAPFSVKKVELIETYWGS